MRSVSSKWFEAIIRYDKEVGNGCVKKVNEVYVVDALTFGEAEKKVVEELRPYLSRVYQIKNINPAQYGEIFFSDLDKDDKFFKARLSFITINEKTQKEKKSPVTYLIQAANLELARTYIDDVMEGTTIDYEVNSIVETKILDVFEHDNSGGQKAKRDAEKKRDEADKKKAEKAEVEQEADK